MSTTMEFMYIVFGLIAILIVATVMAEALRSKYGKHGDNPAVDRIAERITGWWYMLLTLMFALLVGRLGIIILGALISFGAMREFLTLTAKRRADHKALVLCYYVLLPVQYMLIYFNFPNLFLIFIPVYAFFALAIVQAFQGDTTNFLARLSETKWALMISIYSVSHVPALINLDIPNYAGRNVLLITYLVIVVQGSDILQYLFSEWLGGRKMAPRIMPSRTWPGVICGGFAMTMIGALLFWMTPFDFLQALMISAVLVVMGLFGSIVMRAIKRDRGVREWGHVIVGHGGLVDRLDSVMFSAPIFYHIVSYNFT